MHAECSDPRSTRGCAQRTGPTSRGRWPVAAAVPLNPAGRDGGDPNNRRNDAWIEHDRRVGSRERMRSPPSRTNVLVVDASVIAPAVADGGPDGEACRARIKGQSVAAPDLLRVEAVSVIRRQVAGCTHPSTSEQRDRRSAEPPHHHLPDRTTPAPCMGVARQRHGVRHVLRRSRRSPGLRPRYGRPTTRQRSGGPLSFRHRLSV